MLKIVLIAVALGVAGLLAYAATRPDSFRVQRSIAIKAPPQKIYGLIADFRRWSDWSPFETIDADLKRVYGGPEAGEGATYAWDGRKAGAGNMIITRAEPEAKVLIRLEFTRPMKTVNTAEFTLQPNGGTTTVTWAMYGPMSFVSKLMSVFFSMDKVVGGSFEQGLKDLKAEAEG
ncbi:SRPBCC family protein [Phenylobacterium sp.]|uniref:SRPBCC family protein n=1 Tax=Phenylobacterium sp. TaxID=1871053 RepID=UPI0035B218B1